MTQLDPLTQFAHLVRRIAAADYNLAILGDFELPAEQEALLDALAPIPGSEDTGIVYTGSGWDGYLVVTVRLVDLGYRSGQLAKVARMIDENPSDQLQLVEALLRHKVPFQRWVCIFQGEVWKEAVGHGSNDETEVTISQEAIGLRFHASRIARMLQKEMTQAAAEGDS